jgi:hypothetical protein
VSSLGPSAPPPGAAATPYPVADAPPESAEDSSSVRERVVFVLLCITAGAIAAVPAGWLWAKLADPPTATLTANGLSFGELEFNQVTGVTLWFMVIGAVFGLVLGAVVGWIGQRHSYVTAMAVLAMCLVGSAVTMVCGTHLFGPDNGIDMVALFTSTSRAPLKDVQIGDVIRSELAVRSDIAYLGWPVGGLIGALAAMFGWPKGANPAWMPPRSRSLNVQ